MIRELDFIPEYYEKVEDLELDWDVYAVIDKEDQVYSLTYDSKILGRLFELLAAPAIRGLASDHGLSVIPADSQTIYPDFTIIEGVTHESDDDGLCRGDRIISVNGVEISDRVDIEEILDNVDPSSQLECVVQRNNKETEIQVTPPELSRIAVDVKSTYREHYSRQYTYEGMTYEEGDLKPITFTLGSFASFLRKPTKNIQFDYRSYRKHYTIGFLYN